MFHGRELTLCCKLENIQYPSYNCNSLTVEAKNCYTRQLHDVLYSGVTNIQDQFTVVDCECCTLNVYVARTPPAVEAEHISACNQR